MEGKLQQHSTVRSNQCQLLVADEKSCNACEKVHRILEGKTQATASISKHHPLHSLDRNELKEAFKQARREKTQLEKEINCFKDKMQQDGIKLGADLHKNLLKVNFSSTDNPLCKLFWEEQQKAFSQMDKGMRWHPMMLRLAILHSKSPAAYDTLRKTGVLKLPGTSTLREYTSAYSPQEGFCQQVMEELKSAASKLDENKRFVALLHDEMSVKSDLVFDQMTGKEN